MKVSSEILSIDVIPPSPDERCIECEKPITKENDSGWELFTEDGMTRKICCACNDKLNKEQEGKKEG